MPILLIAILVLVSSFIFLGYITNIFVEGLGGVAHHWAVSTSIIGATIAAIGSSAPEFSSSIFSIVEEHPCIGIGTIVGSAIFNITLIIAASSWVRKCSISREVLHRDGLFYLFIVAVMAICIFDGDLSRLEAIGWIFLYGLYLFWIWIDSRKKRKEIAVPKISISPKKAGGYIIAGITGIAISGYALVRSTIVIAETIAESIGMTEAMFELIFSLIIIAIGTSIPDLLTSVQASRKGMGSMAISNAIGSNTFDILIGIGIPFSFRESTKIQGNIPLWISFLIGSVALAMILMRMKWELGKKEAAILVSAYALFISIVVIMA